MTRKRIWVKPLYEKSTFDMLKTKLAALVVAWARHRGVSLSQYQTLRELARSRHNAALIVYGVVLEELLGINKTPFFEVNLDLARRFGEKCWQVCYGDIGNMKLGELESLSRDIDAGPSAAEGEWPLKNKASFYIEVAYHFDKKFGAYALDSADGVSTLFVGCATVRWAHRSGIDLNEYDWIKDLVATHEDAIRVELAEILGKGLDVDWGTTVTAARQGLLDIAQYALDQGSLQTIQEAKGRLLTNEESMSNTATDE